MSTHTPTRDGTVLLSPADAAKLAQVSRETIYREIDRGELPARHVGRQLRIDPAEFARIWTGSVRHEQAASVEGHRPGAQDPDQRARQPRPARGQPRQPGSGDRGDRPERPGRDDPRGWPTRRPRVRRGK